MASTERPDEEDVLGAIGRRTDPSEPLTAEDVADAVGCDRDTARDRLRSLTEQGSLASKQIGGHAVWWRPPSASASSPGTGATGTTDLTDHDDVRAHVEQILEASPVGVVVVEQSGAISFANNRAVEVLGLDHDEIADRTYGQPEWEIYYDDGTPVPTDEHPVTRVLETGEAVYGFEHWIRLADGTERWLSSNVTPVLDEDEVAYVVVGFEDVTPLKARSQRLDRVNRLNTVLRTIQRTVTQAETREEIADTVCETLLNFEEYRLSVIGELSASLEEFDLWSQAGSGEGYLEAVLETDSDVSLSEGMAATATRTGEVQVCQDIGDRSKEHWHDVATRHGIRSYASVPVVYEKSVYGVIGLYSDTAGAFDEHKRRVLSELGESIGSALAALERSAVRDPTTELIVRSDQVAQSVADDTASGELTLDSTVSLSDERSVRYWTVTGIPPDAFADKASQLAGALSVQLLSREGDTSRFEVLVDREALASSFHRLGGELQSVVVEDGTSLLSVEFDEGVDTDGVLNAIRETYPDAELVAQRRILTESYYRRIFDATLTDRQQTVLRIAYFSGYFDHPRKQTGEELANRLDITRQTFHTHLRKALARVLGQLLEDPV